MGSVRSSHTGVANPLNRPPRVPHVESNADSDEEAVVVIARSTQEAIVENLDAL